LSHCVPCIVVLLNEIIMLLLSDMCALYIHGFGLYESMILVRNFMAI
jgi:hypothetical protein